jgi:hypothetical protein
MKLKIQTLGIVSLIIAFAAYFSVLIVARLCGFYRYGSLAEPFISSAALAVMLVLYFSLKTFKIPTYLKIIIYLSIGCTVIFSLIWFIPEIPPEIPHP